MVDLEVPLIEQSMQRQDPSVSEYPSESCTEEIVALAQKFPELERIWAHIVRGGDWDYRSENIVDNDTDHLQISGSDCEHGKVELGADRVLEGSDNAHLPDVGNQVGVDIAVEEK